MTATQQGPSQTRNVTSPTIRRRPARRKLPLLDLYGTAVGKKWVMAVTGIGLMAFVFAHMVGNLKMYAGADYLNEYSAFLKQLLVPLLPTSGVLWIMRVGLLVFFVMHIHAAWSLTVLNRRARPVGYQGPRDYLAASFAARTMRWTGVIVLLFLVWHLADLSWGWANPNFQPDNPYENLVASFQRVPVGILYIVANAALGVHLYHGAWSLFQTMGSMNPNFDPRRNPLRKGFAATFAVVVAGVNISFPIAVMVGIVG